MSDKTVTIRTKVVAGDMRIDVQPLVVIDKSKLIKFENELRNAGAGPGTGADVAIKFYTISGSTTTPISAAVFCKNYTGGDLFTIEATKKKNCKVDVPGAFKYDVTATSYPDLDPVIIVEAPPFTKLPFDPLFAVAAVVIAGLTYVIGYKQGAKKSSATE